MESQFSRALAIKSLAAILIPTALYWQDLTIVVNEALNSDLATHILAIPFILAYIVYRIRRTFIASASTNFSNLPHSRPILFKEISGTLLCLLAYLIKWYGSYTFQPLEYHIASLPIFVAGITLIIFNTQTLRTLLFPIAFLFFLIPPPVTLAQAAGSALATFSSQAAYNVLKTISLPVSLMYAYGSPIIYLKTPSGVEIPFAIDLACSGLYSLIGFIIFATFAAYIVREPIQKKLTILFLGLPLIYALNILRITLIVIIGRFFGPDLALSTFHIFGGWSLILIGTLLLLAIVERGLKIQIYSSTSETCAHLNMNNNESFCKDCGMILKTDFNNFTRTDISKFVLIFAILVSLMLIQVPVFALTEGPAEVFIQTPSGEQTTLKILPEIEGYQVGFVERDLEFEEISGQDASLSYRYLPEIPFKPTIWVGLEIGASKACLHPWEVCLITWPQTHGGAVRVDQLDLSDIHLTDNPPVTARYFVFQEKGSNYTQVVLYWYTQSIFRVGGQHLQKWFKISVINYNYDPQEYETIKAELLPIAKAIAKYWLPIRNWSWAALTIAENGSPFIIITFITLVGTLVYNFYPEINRRKKAKNMYHYIYDPEERLILDVIRGLRQSATVSKIASKFKELSGNEIDIVKLEQKLSDAEEAGIILRKFTNINDNPYLVWEITF